VKILDENNVNYEVVKYINTPPLAEELKDLSRKMGLRAKDFTRKKESEFKELNLINHLDDDEILFKAMSKHPKLIERPIAVNGEKAVLCRPPERVLEII